ncbi:uncharacterized protein LOC143912519 [Arctopsyche grandis]|uniref:uncharacterized protein LOC143912519 n=1 Tax=Arctopsyche grandis TaxID=121162 RepID=UPI00406D820D
MSIVTERVIAEVSKRACLWDVTTDAYKNRDTRQASWLEIAAELFPNFSSLSAGDKRLTVYKIQRRWKNARDCYSKALTLKKLNRKNSKTYVFFEQLKFLEQLDQKKLLKRDDSDRFVSYSTSVSEESETELETQKIKSKKRKLDDDVDCKNKLLEMSLKSSKDGIDTDVAFFQSILPMVRDLDELEKLVFRSKVIEELINIKLKKSK